MNPDFLVAPMPTVSQVGQVSIVLIFAFVGVEVALTPSGEIRDSARTVPRAILSALAIATVIYLAVQTVAQGVLGPELPHSTDAPLAETAGRLLGDGGRAAAARRRNHFHFRVRRRRHARNAARAVRARARRVAAARASRRFIRDTARPQWRL